METATSVLALMARAYYALYSGGFSIGIVVVKVSETCKSLYILTAAVERVGLGCLEAPQRKEVLSYLEDILASLVINSC